MAVNVNWSRGSAGGVSDAEQAAREKQAVREDAVRRREKVEKKREKAEKKQQKAATQQLHRDTVEFGTTRYAKAMADLRREITYKNAEYILYPQRMDAWAKKNAEVARIEANQFNKDYLHSMYNLALKPMDDGLSATGIAECLGSYIGMAITSPTFRRDANRNILKAMTPIVEGAMKADCKVADWTDRGLHALIGKVEKVTGKELPGHQSRAEYQGHDYQQSAPVRKIHEMYAKADNNGRLPYTPESAAVQYLRNTVSAYEAMRQPGADVSKITIQFGDASEMLYKLAEQDGVSKAQLNMNVRTMAGKLISQYPDFRGIFAETAYDAGDKAHSAKMDLTDLDKVKMPDGTTVSVWRGQFTRLEDGKPFEGAFTPRPPAGANDMRKFIESYCDDVLGKVAARGGFRGVVQAVDTPEWTQIMDYFGDLVEDDIPTFCETAAEAEQKINSNAGPEMVTSIMSEFSQTFQEKYGFTAEDEADFRAYEESQKRGRDVSDMPTVDGEEYYDGGGFEHE